ncbi:MAG: ATP-binding protein, partial [Desulfobacterales bacterium]|nr:ATP-binding protein [Desulfobacterales bacterium]
GYEDTRCTLENIPNLRDEEGDSPYFKAMLAAEEPLQIFLVENTDNGETAFMAGKRMVLRDKSFEWTESLRGFLMITMRPEFLARQAREGRIGNTGRIYLTDSRGNILFLPEEEGQDRELPGDLFSEMTQTLEEGMVRKTMFRGIPAFVQGRQLHRNLFAFAVMPEKELLLSGAALGKIVAGVILASILVTGALFYLLLNRLVITPISELDRATRDIAQGYEEGKFLTTEIRGRRDEVGDLGRSFNFMSRNLKVLSQKLEAYNARLEEQVAERTEELSQTLVRLEEKHEQLKHTQAKLIQSEKMAGLGTLVAGVAHEINNPANFAYLGVRSLETDIGTQKAFLLDLLQEEEEIVDILKQQYEPIDGAVRDITEGSMRIKTIVKDLRAFSRLDEAELKSADIVAGLESTLRIIRTQYKKSVRFETDFQWQPVFDCRPAKLNQVFMNLIVNACQAITSKQEETGDDTTGLLRVSTRKRVKDDRTELVIGFEDNGCGMDDTVRQRIFEPFFTTKEVGEGTGMGMSITYGIVEAHGGKLEVESSPGQGSRISVHLPVEDN